MSDPINAVEALNAHKYGSAARNIARGALASFNMPEPLHLVPGYGQVVEATAFSIIKLIDTAVNTARPHEGESDEHEA